MCNMFEHSVRRKDSRESTRLHLCDLFCIHGVKEVKFYGKSMFIIRVSTSKCFTNSQWNHQNSIFFTPCLFRTRCKKHGAYLHIIFLILYFDTYGCFYKFTMFIDSNKSNLNTRINMKNSSLDFF